MKEFLFATSALCMLMASCETCYQDRFAQDVVGMTVDDVIRAVGKAPTYTQPVQGGTIYHWHHDDSYTIHHSFQEDEWKDKKGRKQVEVTPAYDETVNRVSSMDIVFRNGRATVCTFENDGDDCNYFIPQSWIRRYEQEDSAGKAARNGAR